MADAKRIHVWLLIICILCLSSCTGQSGDDGFRIDDDEDSDDDGCHGTRSVQNEILGQVTSPNYPNQYPNEQDCHWRLVAAPGDSIVITFDYFDVEMEDYCQYDNVMVYDGPDDSFDLIGSFCGDTIPGPFVSTYRYLYITFHSDMSDGGRGFSVVYETADTDEDVSEEESAAEKSEGIEPDNQECRHHLSGQEGSMSSPNYPEGYPSNADCVYLITVDVEEQIQLTFLDFETEGYGCSFDYLVVKDGNSEDAATLHTFCGNEIPDPITSSGNSLFLHFVSDGSDNRRGFYFEFEAEALPGNNQQIQEELFFTQSPEDLTVEIGDSVTQQCTANQDDVTILWFKNGELLNQGANDGIYILDDGLFIIPEIGEHHLATYACQIRNSRGIAITASALIHVAGSQGNVDVFDVMPSDASIDEDDDHAFHCEVVSTSEASISWEKDGQPIQFDHRIFQLHGNDLFVTMALLSHGGRYTCVAIGADGERLASASAQLTIVPKKSTEEICGTVTVGNNTEDDELEAEDGFRIVGGKTAAKGSAPWMARLWNINDNTHFCGGSILNDYWVVTAAHCFSGLPEDMVQVRLGDYDDMLVEAEEKIFEIAKVEVYPQYFDFDGDIALIKLANRIQFTDYIRPICLPSKELAQDMLKRRQVGRVLGWGRVLELGAFPRYLNEVNVPVQRKSDCEESAKPYIMTSNMFCAGYRRALTGDACQGDSGGPFVQKRNNRWYLSGIVSWGDGCGKQDEFGFYTKVYKLYPWIDQVLG